MHLPGAADAELYLCTPQMLLELTDPKKG